MSYVIPSVQVYQLLANAGGVLNSSPDLDACIIGPCYNLLDYVPGSLSTMVATAAVSSVSTTGSIAATSNVFTAAAVGGFSVGDSVLIEGAGTDGATLNTTINSIVGNLITLADPAVTALTSAVMHKQGKITNSASTNSFSIAGQKPGQVVDTSSIKVWINNAHIESHSSSVNRTGSSGTLPYTSVLTLATPVTNVNATTSTLVAEPGDIVKLSYTVSSTNYTFTSEITAVTTTNGLNGNLTTVTVGDILPANMPASGTAMQVIKVYNDLVLPKTLSGTNYSTSTTAVDGIVSINPNPKTVYGNLLTCDVYIAYRALRTDLAGSLQDIPDVGSIKGLLGAIDDRNPLALAAEMALANTVTSVKVLGVSSDDLTGYLEAFQRIEDERVYYICPLTQDEAIIGALKAHVDQLSTPQEHGWRVAIVNTAIPTTQHIGTASLVSPNADSGNNITLVSGVYVLTSPSGTFLSDGVIPGDGVSIVSGGAVTATYTILQIVNNQQVVVNATGGSSGIQFFVSRLLTKDQQAQHVAAVSSTWNDKRMWHIQPDKVGITVNGVIKYLPGYYLCAALAGMGAGFPVQQGFTNISVAGIEDLQNSNFYFTKSQLGIMASAGTCIFAQQAQGTAPYCRHELTTDVSVLEYRELQQVKNWDYLSYLSVDKLKMFIGVWNITDDTINTIKQTITAMFELEKSKKLPKIGAPLVDFKIVSITQNAYNKDNLDAYITIKMAAPLNYLNIYLTV